MPHSKHLVLALLTFAIAGTLAAPLSAQDKGDFDVAALFRASCAPCHGVTGDGDGPVANSLKVSIDPMATLAQRNGGEFPKDYVYRVIDGREEVNAHGDRMMPVWGDYFRSKHEGLGTEESTDVKIRSLIAYIKSLDQ